MGGLVTHKIIDNGNQQIWNLSSRLKVIDLAPNYVMDDEDVIEQFQLWPRQATVHFQRPRYFTITTIWNFVTTF